MISQHIRRYFLGASPSIVVKMLFHDFRRIALSMCGRLRPNPVYQSLGDVSEFDRVHGVRTSAGMSWKNLRTGSRTDPYATAYLPSPPSVVRYALARLPSDLEKFTFVDIGCGLGRTMIIASEFPFKAITGIEKSPYLYEIAKFNFLIIKGKYPDRPSISIDNSDVVDITLPDGDIVIYMYDPFLKPVMKSFVKLIESAAIVEGRRIFVIYARPKWRDVLDRSPVLTPDNERSFLTPTNDECHNHTKVAIWQNRLPPSKR